MPVIEEFLFKDLLSKVSHDECVSLDLSRNDLTPQHKKELLEALLNNISVREIKLYLRKMDFTAAENVDIKRCLLNVFESQQFCIRFLDLSYCNIGESDGALLLALGELMCLHTAILSGLKGSMPIARVIRSILRAYRIETLLLSENVIDRDAVNVLKELIVDSHSLRCLDLSDCIGDSLPTLRPVLEQFSLLVKKADEKWKKVGLACCCGVESAVEFLLDSPEEETRSASPGHGL